MAHAGPRRGLSLANGADHTDIRRTIRLRLPMPKAMVIRTAGTNCDTELVRAFTLAGADTQLIHLDALLVQPTILDRADLIGFPGGFSYGDDIASGRIFAMHVRQRLYPALVAAIERGSCIIGVCNGFQVLVQVGLVPGPDADEPWPTDAPPNQTLSLAGNASARFVDRWTGVTIEPGTVCVWTRGLESCDPVALMLPNAHGEGRLVARSPATLDHLAATGRIALRYTDNFNGSMGAVAGICDATGRVLGLMPHPERYLDWTRHPYFTRLDPAVTAQDTPGLRLFRNAVEAVQHQSI